MIINMRYLLHTFLIAGSILFGTLQTAGQCSGLCSHDSTWTICLSEVDIVPQGGNGDAVHNFYRPNKSFTTEEILSRIPALSMIRRSNFGMEPSIRGLSDSRLNVTIDGMKIFGACTDKMDPVTIYVEPQNLESFQTGNGTCGSGHGNTVGGSLDMKLKDPDFGTEGSWHGLSGLTFHSVSSAVTAFSGLDYAGERWAAKMNAVYRTNGNYRAGGGEEVLHSSYEKVNFSTALKYKINKQQSIKGDFLFDEAYGIGFPALNMDVRKATAKISSLTWEYQQDKSVWQEASVKIYGNRILHSMDDFDRQNIAMHMDMPGESSTAGMIGKAGLRFSEKWTLQTHADYYFNSMKAEMYMKPEGRPDMYMLTLPETFRENLGVFIAPTWKPDSQNVLSMNMRFDRQMTRMNSSLGKAQLSVIYSEELTEQQNFLAGFNIEFRHAFSKFFSTGVQAGLGERSPSVQELFGFYLFNRLDAFDYIGNPFLENEKTRQISLSFELQKRFWNFNLTPFFNRLDNYIKGIVLTDYSAMTLGGAGVKQYANDGKASLSGAEFILKYLPDGAWSLISTGKYVYGRAEEGRPLWQIPPFKSTTAVKYRRGLFSVQVESEAAMQQARVDIASGEKQTPGYMIFHLRLNWLKIFGNHSFELNGGVENIIDHKYHEHLDWGGIPRPGRNFYSTIAFRF